MSDPNIESFKEVLENAKLKYRSKLPLSQVEAIVLKEWLTVLLAKFHKLDLKSKKQLLTTTEELEKNDLLGKITEYGGNVDGATGKT